ncbi:MAG: AAA family ATPase [Burkholderiaceae bacterium]|nr:AAA family ATPase [Burkholderiaceae bacterium]
MKSTSDDIRQWLHKQPDWLQDAAERLLKQGSLSSTDVKDLVARLKTADGQKVTVHRTFDSLAQPSTAGLDLRLKSLDALTGIEGLAPRRPLAFGHTNLTVLYGHNGSGKSSYARLLKKVTGKPRASDLKSNVFQAVPIQGKCQFTYELAGVDMSTEWLANAVPVEALRAVDIFDADEAVHYLSSENAAAYTPPVVALFENLALACDQVKAQFQDEQGKLVKALPALPHEYSATAAGTSYSSLKAEAAAATLSALLTWTDENEKALTQSTERLKTTDHAALAKQKRSKKAQVQQVATKLQQAFDAYSLKALEHLRALRTAAQTKRQIATEAAKMESAELDHVGTATWRAMWEAAREYSQEAYPTKTFPVTDAARCVLCHQELSDAAQERLHAFESFVQSKLAAEATQAESAYTQAKNQLPVAWTQGFVNTQAEAAGLTVDESWPTYLRGFWLSVENARAALLANESASSVAPVGDVTDAVESLTDFADVLEKEAIQHDLDAQGIDRVALQKAKQESEGKKWVTQQVLAVRAEIERLKQYKQYDAWKSLANSRPVSQKSGEVAEKVITQAYVGRFNRELQALGATRIKVELVKTKAEKGKVLHRLQLKDVKVKQALENILSEGERRVVALAAFLADLTEKPNNAPFIFDDPISSLDQTWEERTIDRLIQLSETRQVIVFTHRLSFLGLIGEKADEMTSVHIRQEPWGAGETGDVPLYGKKPDSALKELVCSRVPQARKALQEQGTDAYYPLGKSICSDFRILLERIVEFVLLADVVQRHRRAVNTLGKIQNLAKITTTDCALIEQLMTKYSSYEHSQSSEAPVELPEPDELKTDIELLIVWHNEFTKRSV